MAIRSSAIKEVLTKENSEFKQLHETHQSYENRLNQLNSRHYLTADEEVEVSELKKKKLVLKDQMSFIMGQYKKQIS